MFTAGDESQWETITRWIDESDVYMLILGGRYGATHPKTGISYTEMEYDYAFSKGKPVFAVVINESALDERVKAHGRSILEVDHPDRLKKFRKKVLSRISTFFSDTKDIKLAVHETIPVIEQKHDLPGWVSGSEVTDTKTLVDELKRLVDENKRLQKDLKEAQAIIEKAKTKSKNPVDDFDEVVEILTNIDLDLTRLKDTRPDLPEKQNLLETFFQNRDVLARGITNSARNGDYALFLYNIVCPKLQLHGLVENERVPSVQYRRYSLTARGTKFLASLEKELIRKKNGSLNSTTE